MPAPASLGQAMPPGAEENGVSNQKAPQDALQTNHVSIQQHSSSTKAESNATSEAKAAKAKETMRTLRPTRAKTDHDIRDPVAHDSEDDAGNDTEMEEIEEEYEACESRVSKIANRASRRSLSKSERVEWTKSKLRLETLRPKLPPHYLLTSQINANIDGDEEGSPSDTAGASPNASTSTNRKRKNPSQGTSTGAKKLKSSQETKSKSGQRILPDMASSSTTRDRARLSSTTGAQLAQLKSRALQEPGADKKQIRAEIHDVSSAIKSFGGENKVEAKDGDWLLRGMATPLGSYQLTGAAWMMQREKIKHVPSGGILADEMGCGKTITALALISKNQPPKKDKNKVTLIVVPNEPLTTHWINEAKLHCPDLGASRFTRRGVSSIATFGNYQVLVVTYSDIERSWSKVKQADTDQQNMSRKHVSIDNEKILFHATFHRLILDECHLIKNHRSATAKAVFNLKAKHVWCLSATPSPNHSDEYFPYLKILGHECAPDIKTFHQRLFKKGEAGSKERSEALENILQDIQLCRKTTTKFLGKAIFSNVPENSSKVVFLEQSRNERLLYGVILEPLRRELENKKELLTTKELQGKPFSLDEAPTGERGLFVSKILQLYKLTAHPYMLESILSSHQFSLEQIQGLLANFKNLSINSKSVLLNQLSQVCVKVENGGNNFTANPGSQPAASEQSESEVALNPEDSFDMEPQLKLVLGMRAQERCCRMCSINAMLPAEARLTDCGHVFCTTHWEDMVDFSKFKNQGDEIVCMTCRRVVRDNQLIDQSFLAKIYNDRLAAEASGNGLSKASKKTKPNQKERSRGDDFNGYQPKGERSLFLEQSDKTHPEFPLPQSAKTRAVKEIVLQWQKEAPNDKIIIFTQWILMGKILGRVLEDNGIPFLYYFGEKKGTEKDKSLQDFQNIEEIKVMIMGFKCGNNGLNMYYANRVILVEPFWNLSAEDQALARVRRKIQKKETFFVRLLVEDSIDMHISAIKEAKQDILHRLKMEDNPRKRYEMELKFADIALNGAAKGDGHNDDDSDDDHEQELEDEEEKVDEEPEEENTIS